MKPQITTGLRLVRTDSRRELLLERIRQAEGDLVIADLKEATLDELQVITDWLDSGRRCGARAGRM